MMAMSGIESRTVFRHAPRRRAAPEHRQAESDHMREGRLRLAAGPGPRQIASRPARRCSADGGAHRSGSRASRAAAAAMRAAFRSDRRRAAAATSKPRAQIAPRCALLPSVAASMRRSMSRPIRPICSRSRSGDFSTAAARAMSANPSLQGLGGTPQPGQIEIVMRPLPLRSTSAGFGVSSASSIRAETAAVDSSIARTDLHPALGRGRIVNRRQLRCRVDS